MNKSHRKSIHKKKKQNINILAFSGGPDSMYLLHLLLKKDEKPILAHLNHNLRGTESDQDELFCKKIAKQYGLTIETGKIAPPKNEEEARIARYKFLENIRRKHNATKILTAHHLNDSIETFILNLSRGTGLRGLTGIKSDKIERPLLSTTKSEILAYLKKHKIPYRKDSSNQDEKFSRNRIRLHIVPELKKINPKIEKTFATTIKNLQEVQSFIDSQTPKWQGEFFCEKFSSLHPCIQANLLLKIDNEFSRKNISELQTFIKKNHTGSRKLGLEISYGKIFTRPKIKTFKTTFQILKTRPKSLKSKNTVFLNFDKIKNIKKLDIAAFNPGDKIKPLGLNGKTQKLQDIFINKKIPQELRKKIPVIKFGKEIICIGWLAIANKYKVTKTTRQILKISFKDKH